MRDDLRNSVKTFIAFLLSAILVSALTEAAMSCAERNTLPTGYRDAYDAGAIR